MLNMADFLVLELYAGCRWFLLSSSCLLLLQLYCNRFLLKSHSFLRCCRPICIVAIHKLKHVLQKWIVDYECQMCYTNRMRSGAFVYKAWHGR